MEEVIGIIKKEKLFDLHHLQFYYYFIIVNNDTTAVSVVVQFLKTAFSLFLSLFLLFLNYRLFKF